MNVYHKYIKKYWKLFFVAIFFLTIETFADLTQPALMARVVDEGIANGDLDMVLQIGLQMVIVALIGALAACTRSILASIVSQNFGTHLRADLYTKIQKLPNSTIDKLNRASLITRLINDVNMLQNFVNGMMRIFVKAPLISIGAFIMAFRLNWQLALVFLVALPLVILLISIVIKINFPRFLSMQKAIDGINERMREYLSGVRVVKAFNRFAFETEQFETQNAQLVAIATKVMRFSLPVLTTGITLTLNLVMIIILWFGAHFVNLGSASVGTVIAFTSYTTQIAMSLGMVAMVFIMYAQAKASAGRIKEALVEEELSDSGETAPTFKGEIAFNDVSFRYDATNQAATLNKVSFTIMPGSRVGIIGATGSGKTTLINLMTRIYDPTEGEITIDGKLTTALTPAFIRNHIAVVAQKAVLFSGSILDNVRWGNKDATLEHIRHYAKLAQIDDYIMGQPSNYEAVVGQGGVNFSGGQRQRLSLVRALVSEPTVLILDDATSAVDANTEAAIKSALGQLKKEMTVITIAQKISSVAHCDKILVMDHGEVVSVGTHEQLMGTCKIYEEIYASQIGKAGKNNES